MIAWQNLFRKSSFPLRSDADKNGVIAIRAVDDLKDFLDSVHIRYCLAKPYQETPDYPIVESRELLPSFDNDMFEYKDLPGFSLVALPRQLAYFSEIFQYDKLHSIATSRGGVSCPLETQVIGQNIQTLLNRIPNKLHEDLRKGFRSSDVTLLDTYEKLFPYLLLMDRAQVLAWDGEGFFHLAGVFASFPSDIDSELKRFGIRIGKFLPGDDELYERNRMFVYQFLMELYGFPIVSERRTSSALFARKLHKMGERFLLRVLGQTDRTITTYFSNGENTRYPHLEKTALVSIDKYQRDLINHVAKQGGFLDEDRRVVILRVRYRQHAFDPSNIREERALSILDQEILHPLTGEPMKGLNVIKDPSNMILRLNDIVRGEFSGRILYKRTEIVSNTDTDEKKLKFLYSWLAKHQRRMISYSDDFFAQVTKIITRYLYSPDNDEAFDSLHDLHQEVIERFAYIQQARRVRMLEDISSRTAKSGKMTYLQMMRAAAALLNELKFEIVNFFPEITDSIIECVEKILGDSYLLHKYIAPAETTLSPTGLEIKKIYGRLVNMQDGFKAVRKVRLDSHGKLKKGGSVKQSQKEIGA
ncbi:MAG: hypothetical protein K6F46_12130 [Desulfovibrio sp.]|nr:hypothetical protein [Desulfovibrio sp.]